MKRQNEPTASVQKPTIAKLEKKEENESDAKKDMKDLRNTFRSPSDFLPMIKRGFSNMIDDEEGSLVSVGWKHEVTSRKEREEALR
jgi:hypothetical protein